jgi:hypothetical protein
MALEEVERILGRRGVYLVPFGKPSPEEPGEGDICMRWLGEQFELYVSFDLHRRVTSFGIRVITGQIGPC